MRILVTGSAGHLGEALVRTLQNANHEVIGVVGIAVGLKKLFGRKSAA